MPKPVPAIDGTASIKLRSASLDNSQVLFIDPQRRFLDTIHDAGILLERWNHYLKTFAVLGLPIVVTRQYPEKLGPIDSRLIMPTSVVTCDKTTFSCLATDSIADHVARSERRHLIIMGIETALCILQTVRDAHANGYGITLADDAIGGRKNEDSQRALDIMQREGADRMRYDMIVYQLIHDARSPSFSSVLPLIKSFPEKSSVAGSEHMLLHV